MSPLRLPSKGARPPSTDSRASGPDPGLSSLEHWAIRRALVKERNPNHLIGFAGTLAPYYPVSASLLYAKAQLLELRAPRNQQELAEDGREAIRTLVKLVSSTGVWDGERTARWLTTPLDVRASLERTTLLASGGLWTDAAGMWRLFSPPPLPWPRLDRMRGAAEAVQALRSDPSSVSVGAMLVGPAEPSSLQRFGFHELYPKTRGANLRARAEDFLIAVRSAAPSPRASDHVKRIAASLIARRRMELDRVRGGEDEARRAASDLVVNAGARFPDLSPEAESVARCLVVEIGPGIRVIDPSAARLVFRMLPGRTPDFLDRSAERARWMDWHRRAERMETSKGKS